MISDKYKQNTGNKDRWTNIPFIGTLSYLSRLGAQTMAKFFVCMFVT